MGRRTSLLFSIRWAAETLGENEDFLERLTYGNMDPAHGRLTVVMGLDDTSMTVFTEDGIAGLKELLAE
jgi:hypothetical protein